MNSLIKDEMSDITAIKNPLNGDNLIYALNTNGGLGMLNDTPFNKNKADLTKGDEVETGPAVVPSSLTSFLFRNMVCVFGIVVAKPNNTIAMLSPVYQRFPKLTTKYNCISSTVSSDGKECWIYYRDLVGNIQKLSISDMQSTLVVEAVDVSPRTRLAAFTDGKIPKVIYQATGDPNDNSIYVGVKKGSHSPIDSTKAAQPNTRISLTISDSGVKFIYYIGADNYLNRVKQQPGGNWSNSEIVGQHGNFKNNQFAVIHKGMQENEIHFLSSDLELESIIDLVSEV